MERIRLGRFRCFGAIRTIRRAGSLRGEGFDVLTPEGDHGGIVSFRHPESTGLINSLAGRSIFVDDGEGVVRVSPHFYDTECEVDHLVHALTALVR